MTRLMKRHLRNLVGMTIAMVLTHAVAAPENAQYRLPTKSEISSFKKLAAQSVLHVETSLKKIEREGTTADRLQMRREIGQPAQVLLKEWDSSGLTDAVMMHYSACQNMLAAIGVYSDEVLRPPRYQLSEFALQKMKFIQEDLASCRKLRSQVPKFES